MPDIYIDRDCNLRVDDELTWADARDMSLAETVNTTSPKQSVAVLAANYANKFDVYRSLFAIDTSTITVPPSSAVLKIYGYLYGYANPIVAKVDTSATGDSTTNFIASDFGKVLFSAYSSEITSWTVSGYNEITLNTATLADMAALDEFKFALISYTYDFLDVSPGAWTKVKQGMYYSNNSGAKDPYISYVEGVMGYSSSNICGISSNEVPSINGVLIANISKVNNI